MKKMRQPRTVLITGCSSGIGYCAARTLKDRGYRVFATARKQQDVDQLISEAQVHAARLVDCPARELAVGFWLNLMPPGSRTTLHRHDDMDEMLSGVFYLKAPSNSGKLELHVDGRICAIEPVAGDFLFFSPQLPHAVGENLSSHIRLSIGMNFGRRESS